MDSALQQFVTKSFTRLPCEQHLHRYLAEFDFRYSNRIKLGMDDVERTAVALRGAEGKRLTYRRAGQAANA